jgi:glycosyltransferase involved in cell wall biosynthesis
MNDSCHTKDKTMRVLMAHNFYRSSAPSGEDAVYRNEKQLLQERGVEVVSFEKHNDSLGYGAASLLRGSVAMLWSQQTYRELATVIERSKPDLVHLHNGFPLMFSAAPSACYDAGVPLIQTLHNYRLLCANGLLLRDGQACEVCVGRNLLPAIAHGCYRQSRPATAMIVAATQLRRTATAQRAAPARYIALTQSAKTRFVRGGLPAERIVVRGNALPSDPGASLVEAPYFLYVGRLTVEKGVRTLIDAWRQSPGRRLKLVGDGALRAELQAASVNLEIDFLGQQTHAETIELLKSASALILPSECYEGFPMAVVEALATGTPMIISDLLSVSDMLEDPGNALKFAAGNVASLAAAARRMATDEVLRRRMRHANRAMYEEHYLPARAFESLHKIYADLLSSPLRD